MKQYTHRKIKKPLRLLLSVAFSALFVCLLGAASYHQDQQPLKGFNLQVVNGNGGEKVLNAKELNYLISYRPVATVAGKLKSDLNLKEIENIAAMNPWVAHAEAYVDNHHRLQVRIVERKPIARIFDAKGTSFYMDSTLAGMPVIRGTYFNTPVFTDVLSTKDDKLMDKRYAAIAFMAELIGRDSFWNAQIQQIKVNEDQTFVLIPLLGNNQEIIFGDTSRASEKLNNLFAFYKQITPKVGWDSYKTLDLRYRGQIVAKPSLGITIPKAQ